MDVEFIDSEAGIGEIEAEWRELNRSDENSDIFGGPDWYRNWWRFSKEDNKACSVQLRIGSDIFDLPARGRNPFVVVVRRGNALACVVPLVLSHTRWRRLPLRIISPCLGSQSPRSSVSVDQRYSEGDSEHPLKLAFWAIAGRHDWDICVLDGMQPTSCLDDFALSAFRNTGYRTLSANDWAHNVLSRYESWEAYLDHQGRHFRKRLWQAERSIERKFGSIAVVHREGRDAAETGLREFLDIDAMSWKALHGFGETVANDGELESYYKELSAMFGTLGQFETWTLSIKGEPASSFLCLVDERRVYTLKTSYKEKFASSRTSPSMVLLASIVQHAWTRGRTLDFVGSIDFSRRWTDEVINFAPSIVFAPRPAGYAQWLVEKLRARLKSIHNVDSSRKSGQLSGAQADSAAGKS